jgi:hypothetical protein
MYAELTSHQPPPRPQPNILRAHNVNHSHANNQTATTTGSSTATGSQHGNGHHGGSTYIAFALSIIIINTNIKSMLKELRTVLNEFLP